MFDMNRSATVEEIVQLTHNQGFLVNLHVQNFEQNPLEIRRIGTPLAIHIRPQDLLVLPFSSCPVSQ